MLPKYYQSQNNVKTSKQAKHKALCLPLHITVAWTIQILMCNATPQILMCNATVSVLVKELEAYKLHGGLNACEMTSKLYHHVIPLNPDLLMRTVSSSHMRDIGKQRAACSCINQILHVLLVRSTWCLQEGPVMQRSDDCWKQDKKSGEHYHLALNSTVTNDGGVRKNLFLGNIIFQ